MKEGQYAGRESFLEDLMRAFRRSLVAVGPDSDLGRATRGMMKSVKELFMNGLTSYISPGDRVRLPWKTGICDGTVLNIALLERYVTFHASTSYFHLRRRMETQRVG